MTRPIVFELPLRLEPGSRDTFIDDVCDTSPDEAADANTRTVVSARVARPRSVPTRRSRRPTQSSRLRAGCESAITHTRGRGEDALWSAHALIGGSTSRKRSAGRRESTDGRRSSADPGRRR